MAIRKKKISELPLAESLIGLHTIGVNRSNGSVKIGLDFLKAAADKAEAKAAEVDALIKSIEDQCSYGVEWNTSYANPIVSRVGNRLLHQTLPIQNKMRGCLMTDAGNIMEYLHPTNWRAHKRDGSEGQVMIEIPSYYRKFITNGDLRGVRISECPLIGYHFVPRRYIGAYEASVDRIDRKMCSIANRDFRYRGGSDQSDWDAEPKSLLGKPATLISRSEFRSLARERGDGWNCYDYNSHKDMLWLYYIEYANFNSQDAYVSYTDGAGYRTGGIGAGATTLSQSQWTDHNGCYPFADCGATDDFGNYSGELLFDLYHSDVSPFVSVPVNRYRGIENPFGHIWKWIDGINIDVKKSSEGNTSSVYVSDDPAYYSDSSYNGYKFRGYASRVNGFIKDVIFGDSGDFMPSVIGGSSTSYLCDYFYTNVTSSVLRGVMVGGHAYRGLDAGMSCVYTNDLPFNTNSTVGTRLIYIPNEN